MGQTHVHRYLQPLMDFITAGAIDPSFVISHRLSLEEGPNAYDMFLKKNDGCTKVVMRPF
jgi:threonine dehydrogenase-like Zn-dependent dehydrogenase